MWVVFYLWLTAATDHPRAVVEVTNRLPKNGPAYHAHHSNDNRDRSYHRYVREFHEPYEMRYYIQMIGH